MNINYTKSCQIRHRNVFLAKYQIIDNHFSIITLIVVKHVLITNFLLCVRKAIKIMDLFFSKKLK
jgi:hypothetical protein